MDLVPYLAAVSALAALVLAFYFYKQVEAESPGDERMVYLMNEIRTGARAFLKKEYTWVAVFVVAMMLLIALVIDPLASVTYLLGAVLSATVGYAGMNVATIANARTAEAAKSGPGKALPVAFRGGAVGGIRGGRSGAARSGAHLPRVRRVDGGRQGLRDLHGLRARRLVHRALRHAWAAASTPRPPTSAPTSSARSKRHPRGRPAQPGRHRRQRGRQRRRRRRHGRRPVRVVRRFHHRPGGAEGVRPRDHHRAGRDDFVLRC